MNVFEKIKFFLKKPKVVIIIGNGSARAKEAISQILKQHFRIGEEVLILETDFNISKFSDFEFLIKNSSLPVFVVNQNKENTNQVLKLAKLMPPFGNLILNFDEEIIKEMKDLINLNLKILTFGFRAGADFQATDITFNTRTNFKLNYQGNIIPIWLDYIASEKEISNTLVAIVVGTIFNLNLVEISQSLKNYKGLPTKEPTS